MSAQATLKGSAQPGRVTHVLSPDLRAIVCVTFNHRAPPDQVAALKNAVISCPSVLHSVELNGSFDFMFEVAVPDMATYDARLKAVAAPMSKLVDRYEASFVGKRFVRRRHSERAIWVPARDGMQRINTSAIDKVIAQGDYMRVHSDGQSWLLHATMRSFVERLDQENFVQLHRSALVREEFIERVVHEGRCWIARLGDGTREKIAKSHVAEVLEHLRFASSRPEPTSSKDTAAGEISAAG